jgi:FixJ family two-component response regulator
MSVDRGKAALALGASSGRAGAIDFLTKPVSGEDLLGAIARAAEKDAEARKRHKELESINERLTKLTPREREVLTHVIAGRLNKQIAHDLGLVLNTVLPLDVRRRSFRVGLN